MAKLQIRTTANVVVASRDIPDPIIPYAQAVIGGATNAETAQLALDWMWERFKRHIKGQYISAQAKPKEADVAAEQLLAQTTFDTDVP